ncbi:hypothetical protein CLV98_105107 [Dyadobacter jejuensis]|uniref:Uncharacterized protein n=1 Tax=Dyadobacter jejuensis TaxID=1082580 RepID=A0A316B5K9_9BACT|nr:hypothetical protein [Dyadobacter jejuensis]PWJ57927.1 hypothetical protein CLV98_105107 [Dyadobacter jejuensis]
MRWLLAQILLLLTLGSFQMRDHLEEPSFSIKLEDGGRFDVYALKDGNGLLDGYRAHIKAPVCEDRLCYDVNVIFYWNLNGEFLRYEVLPHDPLTKMDHEPFLPEDYKKLQSILTSQDLSFVNIPKDELVTKSDSSEVDGYTGATKLTVKKEVIEGALYTCYTLWHIANGTVVESIKSHTKNAFSKELIRKIIAQDNQTAHYFLINNLNSSQFAENLPEILGLMTSSKGYFSKNTIEKIPKTLFSTEPLQDFIVANYQELDYYTQLAILKKLDNQRQSGSLKQFFIGHIDPKNSFQNQKLIGLVLQNIGPEEFGLLVGQLQATGVGVSEENFQALQQVNEQLKLNISMIQKL